nr:hypothetical protein [Tanacetum cinerariifolium]
EINTGDQDEGQARPNRSKHDEGQAISNPGDVVESPPQSSHVSPHQFRLFSQHKQQQSRQQQLFHHYHLNHNKALQRIGELEQYMENLIQDNLALEERLDKHGTRLYNLESLNIPQKTWMKLARRRERDVTHQELLLGLHLHSHLLHHLQLARLVLQVLWEHQDLLSFPHLLLFHLLVHQDLLSNKVQLSDDEDTRNDQLTKVDTRKDWLKPLPEEERLATPEPA